MLRDPRRPVRVSLATDVGGGTSYSMLRTAAEAYKVLQLRRQNLPAFDAFYLMTLGNARALSLEDRIGSLEPGRDADLVVLDARATPAMAHRMETVRDDLAEELFVLMTMGDDRSVRATYVAGERRTPPDGSGPHAHISDRGHSRRWHRDRGDRGRARGAGGMRRARRRVSRSRSSASTGARSATGARVP